MGAGRANRAFGESTLARAGLLGSLGLEIPIQAPR